MEKLCLSSGAGLGRLSPAKASNSSSDEDPENCQRRNHPMQKLKRKRKLVIMDDEENENEAEEDHGREETSYGGHGKSEEQKDDEATPIGDVVRVSGSGDQRIKHYRAFEWDGNQYNLEDPVLLAPIDPSFKPYVVIIKDITENSNGEMLLSCQCFVRPEDARMEGGGSGQECDSRELYYTFDLEIFNVEGVMHTCIVHYIPLHKQLPHRRQFPGFVVRWVYDTEQKELFELTDEKFEYKKKLEINLLLNETVKRIGHLPDLDMDVKLKSPMSMSKNEDDSKYQTILARSHALSKDNRRDYWLKQLLQSVEFECIQLSLQKGGKQVVWPDSAVSAVTLIERTLNKKFPEDDPKYKEKMQQLVFNLKNNARLAHRVLTWDLKHSVILSMSPIESKEGLTAEEAAKTTRDSFVRVQMDSDRHSQRGP